ncbi:hypothetical protein SK128_019105 [Halocaridina rubra]|uniref:Sulfotransferase domain-containing protein n=1 Tax=Halocaridina rubra TaxID=373956 RepID=A0AAN8WGN5_HALRR
MKNLTINNTLRGNNSGVKRSTIDSYQQVIRIRMSWIKVLLDDPYIDLKIIHLVRDPRATIISRSRTFHSQGLHASFHCQLIETDLRMTPLLMKGYPGKIMGITYEDFCMDPKGKATELWRFITNDKNSPLPTAWLQYITKHTSPPATKKDYAYSTYRNTSIEYQQ